MENYPSQFAIDQVVEFVINDSRHTSTIRSVHFTKSKVRYDIDIWLDTDGGNSSTRIYNVDSCFVELPNLKSLDDVAKAKAKFLKHRTDIDRILNESNQELRYTEESKDGSVIGKFHWTEWFVEKRKKSPIYRHNIVMEKGKWII